MDELFYEIFSDLPRQGPGELASTLKAAREIIGISDNPAILDVGCGTGKQTLVLADYFGGKITAVDNHQPFLDELFLEAQQKGFSNTISCLNADMLNPAFVDGQFDLIWAEGSIFIIGFKKGLEFFKKLLKPAGYIAVTEVSWFKGSPPKELEDFWNSEYPGINTIENNLDIINTLGYKIVDHFTLPDSAWLGDYYNPLETKLKRLRNKYEQEKEALELIETVQHEIDIFHEYSSYYGYMFFILHKK